MPRPVHFEIFADDSERAVKFYTNVFGWEIKLWEWEVPDMPPYWMVMTGPEGEPGINGGLMKRMEALAGEGAPRSWVCTLGVTGIDEWIKKVTDNGGGIHVPKMEVPGVGWMVYCTDTEGNVFGLIEMNAPM